MVEDQDPRRKIDDLEEVERNVTRASLDSLAKIRKEALTSNC